jgi:tetratricopeptide (TPR) repeat protein/serine/threonine protein kinase
MTEREIFIAALHQRDPAERAAVLNRACGEDRALRDRVEALLGEQERLGSFLEEPAEGAGGTAAVASPPGDATTAAAGEGPGTVIGPYKLLEQIGEGGFGIVFMAEQQQPLRRKVALKVLKPGMDSRQVIARFEAERQALALMDHANIAKVLDAGQTGSGRPYFVMDLVKGLPITAFCDQGRLKLRERLELFVHVCQAVQHAHQKGIIHRDLKPSNVLVTLHDGTPLVKVIDFGIAKALGQPLTDRSVFTGFAQMIGTPLYMSPEQAALSNVDVDTRSDIYALGVLLYELLTGTTPFDQGRFQEAGHDEMRRIIREEEPPRPSTRLSTLGQAATTAATQRQSDPRRLRQLLRGELDWIVMRALEKDRNRRYETASAFAADVQRFLHDEPVHACPPSAWYRVRKFTRRNQAGLAFAGLILFFLVALGGSIGWRARDRAALRAETERVVSTALEESVSWQRQRRLPEALSAARRAHGLLAGADVDEPLRRRVKVRLDDLELVAGLENVRLDKMTAVTDGHFDLKGADALYGQLFRDAGLDVEAMPAEEAGERIGRSTVAAELAAMLDHWALVRRTIRGADDPSWKALLGVARLADPDAGRTRVREALAKGDPQALRELAASEEVFHLPIATLTILGSALGQDEGARGQAEAFLREAQRRHPNDFWLNHNLFHFFSNMRHPQVEEALRFATVAVALRPESPGTHYNLGNALADKGRLDEAIAAFREAIRLKKDYAEAHCNLGNALAAKGRLDDAIAEYRQAIDLKKDFAEAHCNLGSALRAKGRPEEAIEEYRQAIHLKKDYAEAHCNLSVALADKGRLDEAIAECHEAIRLKKDYAGAHNNLGNALAAKGRLDDAIAEYRQAIDLKKDYAVAHCNLGNALADKGRLDEAIAAFREAIRLKKDYAEAHYDLGTALQAKGRLDEAIAAFREAIHLKKDYAEAHCNLGGALAAKGRLDEAIRAYQEAIRLKKGLAEAHYNFGIALQAKGLLDQAIRAYQEAIRLKKDYAEAHCNLGGALEKNGSFTEALVHRRRGHELGSKIQGWSYPSAQWLKRCERLVELDDKLPAILSGQTQPADTTERLALAELCQMPCKKLYAAAARFYAEAFADKPQLADDLRWQHRYNAACAAALAGCGLGKDADQLDTKECARLRRQALDWLRADLRAYRQELEKSADKAGPAVAQRLQHWLEDDDFVGVRGRDALAKLPEADRQEWRDLWEEVETLQGRAAVSPARR